MMPRPDAMRPRPERVRPRLRPSDLASRPHWPRGLNIPGGSTWQAPKPRRRKRGVRGAKGADAEDRDTEDVEWG